MITSTSNVLYVQFYSDVSVQGAGFNATYTQANGMHNFDLPFSFYIAPFCLRFQSCLKNAQCVLRHRLLGKDMGVHLLEHVR